MIVREELAEEKIKILILGLDNSGKTSIVQCLQGLKRISAFNSPQPTRDYKIEEFEALNSKYVIWDLGGQEAFRNDHIIKLDKYMQGTRKILYVFDIQDVNRYDLAIKYMKEVLNSLNNPSNIEVSIFLHKYDPDLEFNQNLNERVIRELIEKIKEAVPTEINYSMHKTSIYAIFEKYTI